MAKLWYPSFGYSNELYAKNFNQFRFPNDVKKYGRLRKLVWFSEEEKVNISALFGYDQLGVFLYTNVEIERDENILENVKNTINRTIKGYQSFKAYFLKNICPKIENESDFKFKNEKILIDLSEFFENLDIKQQSKLLSEIQTFLRGYSSNVELILFNGKLYNLKKKLQEEEGKILDMNQLLQKRTREDFYSIYVMCENIHLFIYHHMATRALSLDPSLKIVNACELGFFATMALLDLHYDVEELYDSINEEKSKLKSLDKKRIILTGLDQHREKIIQLEKQAKTIENDLKEIITLAKEINDSLYRPCDDKFKERSDYAIKVQNLMGDMDSLPYSQFEAAGILEHYKLGGLRNIREDVDQVSLDLRKIEIKQARSINTLQIVLSILILATFFGFTSYYNIEIGWIADILQIVTFVLALLILLIRIRPRGTASK